MSGLKNEEENNNHITLQCLNKPECGIKFLYEKDDNTFFTHTSEKNEIKDNRNKIIKCLKCDSRKLKFY